MKRFALPAIELCGLIAAVYFGAQWYLHPSGNYEAAFALSGMLAFLSEWFRRHVQTGVEAKEVAAFIDEGGKLLTRRNENPLPVEDEKAWVARMVAYFRKLGRTDYAIRLNDFSGLVFYGDGSDKSKYSTRIDGRLRRLHEFLRELSGSLK